MSKEFSAQNTLIDLERKFAGFLYKNSGCRDLEAISALNEALARIREAKKNIRQGDPQSRYLVFCYNSTLLWNARHDECGIIADLAKENKRIFDLSVDLGTH